MIKQLERWPVHPFLFALYPVLALLAVNAQDVPPQAAVRPIVLSLALAGFLLVLTRLVLRRWTEAAVLTTLALLLFSPTAMSTPCSGPSRRWDRPSATIVIWWPSCCSSWRSGRRIWLDIESGHP